MHKTKIILIGMLVISMGIFSGCTDLEDQINEAINKMKIDSFDATPGSITTGETSTLSWEVTGATAVTIDNGIGSVALQGTRVVTPTETTTYTLTATNDTTTLTANAQVLVQSESEQAPSILWFYNPSDYSITISSGSASHTYATNSTIGNLIFKIGSSKYYVKSDLSISLDQTDLSTETIDTGDEITGFPTAGTWYVIWEPTDTTLGTIDFTSTTDYPTISWTVDDSADTLTITAGSSSHSYGASSTDGNLIFKQGTTKYYVKEDLSISTEQTDLSTSAITAGDIITGFTTGIWQIIWEPADIKLGDVTFIVNYPSLAWTVNDADDTLTITVGSLQHRYASSSGDGNLIFRLGSQNHYVKYDKTISYLQTELLTTYINAGDIITGFSTGTWSIIWGPTYTTIGTIEFSDQEAPNMAWTVDDTADTLTITAGSSSHSYGASSTDGNLIFKLDGTEYFAISDLSINTSQTGLSTAAITAGDIITGFTTGTWSIIWDPTGETIGTITFNDPSPSIAWTIDDSSDTITITSGSSSHNYADSTTDGNLIFKLNSTTNYYLQSDLSISTQQTNLSTANIAAGDIITGFTLGSWDIYWNPNSEVLGTAIFT